LQQRWGVRLGTVLRVPSRNAWQAYGRLRDAVTYFEAGDVVGLSCGPLGRVLVAEWYRQAPEVTFIDLGSALDPFTRGVRHAYQRNELPFCHECNGADPSP
jgi:hypothetical protein